MMQIIAGLYFRNFTTSFTKFKKNEEDGIPFLIIIIL